MRRKLAPALTLSSLILLTGCEADPSPREKQMENALQKYYHGNNPQLCEGHPLLNACQQKRSDIRTKVVKFLF